MSRATHDREISGGTSPGEENVDDGDHAVSEGRVAEGAKLKVEVSRRRSGRPVDNANSDKDNHDSGKDGDGSNPDEHRDVLERPEGGARANDDGWQRRLGSVLTTRPRRSRETLKSHQIQQRRRWCRSRVWRWH